MVPADAGYDIVLGTRRLVLRRLVLDDLDALAAIQRDPEVMRFLGGPRTRARSRQTLGLGTLISLIHPANVASQAVALRIGMYDERDIIFEGRPTRLYALPVEDA